AADAAFEVYRVANLRLGVSLLRLEVEAHRRCGVVLLGLSQIDGRSRRQLLAPHSETRVVRRANLEASGRDVDQVAGHRVRALEKPAKADGLDYGIGNASTRVLIDLVALNAIVGTHRKQDLNRIAGPEDLLRRDP